MTRAEWLRLAHRQSDRFWSKVEKSNQCWTWLAGKDKDGYGKFAITAPRGHSPKQKHVRAHRLSYEMKNGLTDESLVTRHTCDNASCVNPNHILLGTQADNRNDCGSRGRNATGSRHGSKTHPHSVVRGDRVHTAKMSEADVRAIRKLRSSGRTLASIASMYGINQSTVDNIAKRKSWKHVG